MKTLYSVIFLFIAVFLLIQLALYLELTLPAWVVGYVNDFLCMPLVLTACLKVAHVVKKDKRLKIPLLPILVLTSFYAVYFELYLPKVNSRYTADILDIVMYFSGSFLFYFLQFRK